MIDAADNPLDDPRCVAFELLLSGEDVPTVRRWLVALVGRGYDDAARLVDDGVKRVILRSAGVLDSYPHLADRLKNLADARRETWIGYAEWMIAVWAPLNATQRGSAVDARWKTLRSHLGVRNDR